MSHLLTPLLHPLDYERFGSKAARLAHAAALGARVPPSLVIPVDLHGAALARAALGETPRLSANLVEALGHGLDTLGPPPWVVRTSAATEDLPGASATGLYRSELGLTEPADVVAAVRRCWGAAHSEGVGLYLRASGRGEEPLPAVAILLQRQVQACWAGVLFTRDPQEGSASEHLRCELARASTTGVTAGLMDPVAHTLDRHGKGWPALPPDAGVSGPELVALAALAEQTAGGPADVELALTTAGPVVLQVRPITAWSPGGVPSAERDDDGLVWRWDAEHNPAPLSPLHASLVARLDRNPALPFRLRCVGGYLYHAPRPGAPPAPAESPAQIHQSWPQRRSQLESLLEPLETLETLGQSSGPQEDGEALTEALAAFDTFYERYATLAGAPLGSSHGQLASLLDERLARGELRSHQLHETLAGVTTPLTAALGDLARQAAAHPGLPEKLARGQDVSGEPGGAPLEEALRRVIARLGALPPAWDLAAPTLGESPTALRRTVAALARAQPRDPRPTTTDPLLRNLAADEEDDLLFARGLAVLRRACLRAGEGLARLGRLDRAEDVFRLELSSLLAGLAPADNRPVPTDLRSERAPAPKEMDGEPCGGGPLRGFGSGTGVVQARALVVERPERELLTVGGAASGRIVVCASLLPSAVVLLAGAAGIVTDHGGLLSHGAILSRELGLPAVLGTRLATAQLRTDDRLWLDAAQGLVIRL